MTSTKTWEGRKEGRKEGCRKGSSTHRLFAPTLCQIQCQKQQTFSIAILATVAASCHCVAFDPILRKKIIIYQNPLNQFYYYYFIIFESLAVFYFRRVS